MKFKQSNLFHIQFLGFRYHGWLKLEGYKTIQGMIDKTFEFIFKHNNFKTIGCSRTDAKVSATHYVFELLSDENLKEETFLPLMNKNLPGDIRVMKIEKSPSDFNIIQHTKQKTYQYHFAFGEKLHPFATPLIVTFSENLDIDLMKEGARLLVGKHHFKNYCAEPKEGQNFDREILHAEIKPNQDIQANFFPNQSWIFEVKGEGFLRYQVRLMMGALVRLGRGEISLDDIKASLEKPTTPEKLIAPSSGLCLVRVDLH